MKVLVLTIVHDPIDSRVYVREIGALLAAGVQVTYAAPFSTWGRPVPPGVIGVDLERAHGRNRLRALWQARQFLKSNAAKFDVVLFHNTELLLALVGLKKVRRRTRFVWDVHEDTAASVSMKAWIPRWLRWIARRATTQFERWAERRIWLLLAEYSYQERFTKKWPVVPNSVPVPVELPPEPGADRLIYVGHLARPRGVLEMLEVAQRLPDIKLEIIGHAEPDMAEAIAQATPNVTWLGYLPNAQALARIDGALAGLCLLHYEPNFAYSAPTKIMEYMAHRVPSITTANPTSKELVETYNCGIVVDFGDVAAVCAAVRRLQADPTYRLQLADQGRTAAAAKYNWAIDGPKFVQILREIANTPLSETK